MAGSQGKYVPFWDLKPVVVYESVTGQGSKMAFLSLEL